MLHVCTSGVLISSVCANHSMDFRPGLLRTSMAHMWYRTPLPGLSDPVPGHCCLNRSWLAIWTGKCAKGWHMGDWITAAPLFHTVERNTWVGGAQHACKLQEIQYICCDLFLCFKSALRRMIVFLSSMNYYDILIWSVLPEAWKSACSECFYCFIWCMMDEFWRDDFISALPELWLPGVLLTDIQQPRKTLLFRGDSSVGWSQGQIQLLHQVKSKNKNK